MMRKNTIKMLKKMMKIRKKEESNLVERDN